MQITLEQQEELINYFNSQANLPVNIKIIHEIIKQEVEEKIEVPKKKSLINKILNK